MSEKLRNENMGESQRETFQKDVQSPSVSSFDQKKEFFEHVLQEDVPKEEIKTEQKKDIIEDLQTIGQNQEGKSFDKKKEFFENIGEVKEDDKVGEKVSDTSRVSESQEKLSPTQEWRNKYEGPSQSPLGFESSDIGDKDRSSQSQVLGQQGSSIGSESLPSQKDSSFGSFSSPQQGKEGSTQSQNWSNQQQGSSIGSGSFSSQKDSSFGSNDPSFQQGKEGSSTQSQNLETQQQGKEGSTQSKDWSNQQQGTSIGSGSFSSQKDSSFGSNDPSFQQGKEGSSTQSKDWSNQQGKEGTSSQSQNWGFQQGIEQGSSIGSETFSLQKDTSFGSDVPQEKKEGFSSFFPKEGSTQQQGDLISFGSEKGQETSLGSVSSTLPQETQGKDLSNKDEKLKSKRKKGFEPKDPLQKTNDVSNESGIEKK